MEEEKKNQVTFNKINNKINSFLQMKFDPVNLFLIQYCIVKFAKLLSRPNY